jgi:hypothetical protein
MKFVLALFSDESGWDNATPEDMQQGMEPWNRFERELYDSGGLIAGEGFRPSNEARTVKLVDDGEPEVSRGPFLDLTEQLGGVYLIDVDNIDEAVEWAKKIPLRPGSSIEVRPVMDYEQFGFIDPAKQAQETG